ncbi:MAG: AAA family ATPase, partial [Planctomycetota bacterium]
MLIRAIRGENFMKFHRLCLEDLPAEGLIGIEGQNEGGKSTIGELVQFALFGKSISSVESSILELINWEQDQCAVELDFEVPEGAHAGVYRIWREVDRYGTNFARLTQWVEGSDDEWRELASGLMQVQSSLADLVRFDFDDFTRSFFLAEREFPRSPEAMRRFLDRMVGADVLVAVSEEVRTEIQEREGEFGRLQAEIKRNQQQ